MALTVIEKLDRINESLRPFCIEVGFVDYTLKNYDIDYKYIYVKGIQDISGEVHLNLHICEGKVVFSIDTIHPQQFSSPDSFDEFVTLLMALRKSIKYCNSLELTIPEYGSLDWRNGKRIQKVGWK